MSESNFEDFDELPAILTDALVARQLGMPPDWIELLEKKGHLKSLGGRTPGCQRYYATVYILPLRRNQEWLDKAVRLVRLFFRGRNAAKRHGGSND